MVSVRKDPNGNESRADFCVLESEKTSKNEVEIHFRFFRFINFYREKYSRNENEQKNGPGMVIPGPLCLQSDPGLRIIPGNIFLIVSVLSIPSPFFRMLLPALFWDSQYSDE